MKISFIDDEQKTLENLKLYLDKIFNSDTLVIYDIRSSILSSVLSSIPHVATYDQRILPILSNCTFLCSEPFDKEILTYYQSLWISTNIDIITLSHQSNTSLVDQILWDEKLLDSLKGKFTTIVVFFPTLQSQLLADKIGCRLLNNVDISLSANSKVELKKYIVKNELPYIEGIITSNQNLIKDYFYKEDEYFFKLAQGVSWYGFFSNKSNSLEEIISNIWNDEIIIEKKINIVSSPSVQFFIDGQNVFIYGITDQVLIENRYYNGNTSPSHIIWSFYENDLILQSKEVLWYLLDLWYQWFWWIDFMITDQNDIYIAEINARFTWATPPTILNLLLHSDFYKKWIFRIEEWLDKNIDFYKENDYTNKVALCLGWLKQWWQLHTLYFIS